ncbi:tungstate transport system ATP-binding protein [Cupriavidus metallidurans]|jgi:tungstate transport system ATP-binding protein|uniref:ABC transporter ATP-binding protein n=1 Tax=Cupriavidus metallidurans TaxID=119219 RepID=A0A482IUU4_9BURK|nr:MULTISPECIES: ABC transporter ATP-binding protein [Cupriavidus]PCH54923.1 MAG: ABC transporter ATP-binding protein [Burkholderiaceae bacterium]HBO78799.1 ABC transporter ATP-binding protein [Cupriavidus sp.]ELA00916.1 ABC transporter ATPase [Cupriavidus sp. HMR-1]KWR77740.1 ABC transporter ATP-binding protein [Cupriavidus sp. SHE]MDE4919321.1 ABC transporter ATP-binding protein [Cupriavidus metallidurans]
MSTRTPAPLLTVRGLSRRVGARKLFDIAELDFPRATAIALTGVNGAGKSTLLRIVAGLEPAPGATASWTDANGTAHTVPLSPLPMSLRRRIAYMHQHPYLFRTSVRENIAYGLRHHGLPRDEIDRRVGAALGWAGVVHVQDTAPDKLSGGEIQRVALARAKVLEPDLLLLDEPTSSLDGHAREQVIALIGELAAEGRTVVMVCHDRELINLPGVVRWKLGEGRLDTRHK